ncbi:MAG: hypothetical protein IKQ46_10340 [Bacteroidales bacterium]|nr:hypothetical protein [Bacteroidales bacterium]
MLKNNITICFILIITAIANCCSGQNYKLKKYSINSDSAFFNIDKSFWFRDLDTSFISKLNTKYLTKFADCGYPFCKINCDSIVIKQNKFFICNSVSLGKKYILNNIFFVGNPKINKKYIFNITNLHPKSEYNETNVKNIDKILNNCELINIIKSSEIEFHPEDADLYLFLKNKKTNLVNAIATINYDENSTKYFLTGNAELKLQNNFGEAEKFYFNWIGYNNNSQELNTELEWPFINGSRTSANFDLELIKTDSTCLNIRIKPMLEFLLTKNFHLGIFTEHKKIIPTKNIADISQKKINLYGVSLSKKNSIVNGETSIAFGNRNSGETQNPIMMLTTKINSEIKIIDNLYYEINAESKTMISKDRFDIHENYMLGGSGNLRGYNENEIFATEYCLLNNDLKLHANENFILFCFYDCAIYRCKTQITNYSGTPMGIGLGIGTKILQTNINLAYALPIEKNKTNSAKLSKIHIKINVEF